MLITLLACVAVALVVGGAALAWKHHHIADLEHQLQELSLKNADLGIKLRSNKSAYEAQKGQLRSICVQYHAIRAALVKERTWRREQLTEGSCEECRREAEKDVDNQFGNLDMRSLV